MNTTVILSWWVAIQLLILLDFCADAGSTLSVISTNLLLYCWLLCFSRWLKYWAADGQTGVLRLAIESLLCDAL